MRSREQVQMSESMELGAVLALAGGFMDAYSYICRGGVFANAQTGNIVLLGIHLARGEWLASLQFIVPIVAFMIGIGATEITHQRMRDGKRIHWRQISVGFEIVFLLVVSFLPPRCDMAANSLISLVCGIQVESFRKIKGMGAATTMCTGNLRSGTQQLYEYFRNRNRDTLRSGLLYYSIILFFIVGAVLGNYMVQHFAQKAMLMGVALLVVAFIMMFMNEEK